MTCRFARLSSTRCEETSPLWFEGPAQGSAAPGLRLCLFLCVGSRCFFEQRQSHVLLQKGFPDFVKRLELVLYKSASSKVRCAETCCGAFAASACPSGPPCTAEREYQAGGVLCG